MGLMDEQALSFSKPSSDDERSLGTLLGERLCFTLTWSNKLECSEASSGLRVPITFRGMQSNGLRPTNKTLQCCKAVFVPRQGVELRLLFLGGGCSGSKTKKPDASDVSVRRTDPFEYALKKQQTGDDSQELAQRASEEIAALAHQGLTSGMRLAELEDIPQVSIKGPYTIAMNLIAALQEPALWSLPGNNTVRATISRLARRNMLDHIFLDRTAFFTKDKKALVDALKDILAMAKAKDAVWSESGVIANISVLQMFVVNSKDTEEWWLSLFRAANSVFSAYSSKNPLELLPVVTSVYSNVSSLIGTKFYAETLLLVDDLYATFLRTDRYDDAAAAAIRLLEHSTSWKNLYLALSCMEWAIHRNKLSETHIRGLGQQIDRFIAPVSLPLLKRNQWRLREKCACILVKLSEKSLLSELLEKLRSTERDKRILRVLATNHSELYVEPRVQVVSNLPALSTFIGREDELQQLTSDLFSTRHVKIVGTGGIGKTYLALALAASVSNSFDIVWKCVADTHSNLASSVNTLTKRLKLDDSDQLRNVLEVRRCLLVLDNLDHEIDDEHQELLTGKVFTCITSRNALQTNAMLLSGLSLTSAEEYVLGLTKRDTERANIRLLCQELSCIPLALKNVSALLNFRSSDSVAQIIIWIKEDPEEIDTVDANSKRLTRVLRECISRVTSEPGKCLLRIVADLAPDGIPESLYSRVFTACAVEGQLRSAKRECLEVSLVQEDNIHALVVHRLVQQCIQQTLGLPDQLFAAKVEILLSLFSVDEKTDENLMIFKSVEAVTSRLLAKTTLSETEFSLQVDYVYFCTHTLGSMKSVMPCIRQSIENARRLGPAVQTNQLYRLAVSCRVVSLYDEAEEFFSANLKLDSGDNKTQSLTELTQLNFQKGRDVDGARLGMQVMAQDPTSAALLLSLFRTTIEDNPRETMASKVEEYFLKGLERERVKGNEKSHESASILIRMATMYEDTGRLEKSEQCLLIAKAIYEEISPDSLELSPLYNNISLLYNRQGRFQEARDFMLKSIELKEQLLPPDHLSFAISFCNLAGMYKAAGDSAQAELYYLKAVSVCERAGQMNREYAAICHEIAEFYQQNHRDQDAFKYLMKCIEIKDALGETNDEIFKVLIKFINDYFNTEEGPGEVLAKAEMFFAAKTVKQEFRAACLARRAQWFSRKKDHKNEIEVYELLFRLSTEFSWDKYKTVALANVAVSYFCEGRIDEALAASRQVEDILAVSTPSSADRFTNLWNQLSFIEKRGNAQETEEFRYKMEELCAQHGYSSPKRANNLMALVSLLNNRNHLDQALKLSHQARSIYEKTLPNSESVVLAGTWIGELQHRLKLLDDAEKTLVDCEQRFQEVAPASGNRMTNLDNLGYVYAEKLLHDDEERTRLHAVNIAEQFFPNSIVLANTRQRLATFYKNSNRYSEAGKTLVEVEEMLATHHAESLERASNLNVLGWLLHDSMQQHDEAKSRLLQAADLYAKFHQSAIGRANCLKTIGDMLADLKQYAEAELFYQQAEDCWEHFHPTDEGRGANLGNYAHLFLDQNRFNEAKALRLRAVEFLSMHHPGCEILAINLSGLGRACCGLNEMDEARSYFEKAIQIATDGGFASKQTIEERLRKLDEQTSS